MKEIIGILEELSKKSDAANKELLERLYNIEITLGKQQVSLDEHIRRTNLLEAKQDRFGYDTLAEFKAINSHITKVRFFVVCLLTLVPLAVTLWKFWR